MLSDCTCSLFLFGWYSRTHFVCQIATESMRFFTKLKTQNIMSAKHKFRDCRKLLPQFRQYTGILSGAVVTFGLVRFLTFGALKVCYDVDTFQPMKIHVSKIMN